MIQVLLADDHRVLCDGMRRLLESDGDIRVVAVAGDGRDAIAECAKLNPGVALMDVSMPGLDGIEATREIAVRTPATGVVILSMYSAEDVVLRALEAGARGYLLKESAGEEVVAAVRAVAAGGRYFGRGVKVGNVEAARISRRASPALNRLNATEREIIRLLAEGRSNAETAATLGLSPRTVETYRGRLMQKLAIGSFPSLVKFAIRNGLTRPE